MAEKKYRDARKMAGIRAEEACTKLGVSITTLYNWENGITTPDANKLREMALMYGVSADYILGLAFSSQ
jgi:transcriptional regulator with XRE-family HTH domain